MTFDCADPRSLSLFWNATLGYEFPAPPPGFGSVGRLLGHLAARTSSNSASASEDPKGRGPRLFFQRVPEGKTVKNRVHLDVRAAPASWAIERMAALEAECERLVALGRRPARALRARSADEQRPHRHARPRGQRVLPRLMPSVGEGAAAAPLVEEGAYRLLETRKPTVTDPRYDVHRGWLPAHALSCELANLEDQRRVPVTRWDGA